jgi:hypothetical protein
MQVHVQVHSGSQSPSSPSFSTGLSFSFDTFSFNCGSTCCAGDSNNMVAVTMARKM